MQKLGGIDGLLLDSAQFLEIERDKCENWHSYLTIKSILLESKTP